jgi:hypothetical protein
LMWTTCADINAAIALRQSNVRSQHVAAPDAMRPYLRQNTPKGGFHSAIGLPVTARPLKTAPTLATATIARYSCSLGVYPDSDGE